MHVAAVGPGRAAEPVRTFKTFTGDLHRLADWFAHCAVRTVVMELTGVYWIPVYEILEQRGFEVMLVNARDAKHVPGRKTDVSDAAPTSPASPGCASSARSSPRPGVRRARSSLRGARHRLDADPRAGSVSGAQAGRRMRNRPVGVAERQALHLLAVPGAEQQDLRREGAVVEDPPLRQPGGAVPFYNALRHGMDYADPGASVYEERYRRRVLASSGGRSRWGTSCRRRLPRRAWKVFLRKLWPSSRNRRNEVPSHRRITATPGRCACFATRWRFRPAATTRGGVDRKLPGAVNRGLLADVRRIHEQHRRRYGAPRIHAALRAEGHPVSRGRIERLMRRHGIRAATHRRFRVVTTDSNHARQSFRPPNPVSTFSGEHQVRPRGRWPRGRRRSRARSQPRRPAASCRPR